MHLANTLEQNERRRGHNLYLTSRRHHESGDVISWMLQRACPNKHTLNMDFGLAETIDPQRLDVSASIRG